MLSECSEQTHLSKNRLLCCLVCRWFGAADVEPVPEAKMLDIILYSREQLMKEYNAMPEKGDPGDLPQVGFFLLNSTLLKPVMMEHQLNHHWHVADSLGHHFCQGGVQHWFRSEQLPSCCALHILAMFRLRMRTLRPLCSQ